MSILCIYHSNCADGFGAVWAVRDAHPDTEFFAGTYQNSPPDATDRDVVLVDFSYKRPVLRELARKARSVLVLDHHKSADDDLVEDRSAADGPAIYRMEDKHNGSGEPYSWDWHLTNSAMDHMECGGVTNIYAVIDQKRSGAGLAWDFFHQGQARPRLIDHIEDRDLWRFALPLTREIQANVFSYPYDFAVWDKLMASDPATLAAEGSAIERKHFKDVAELVAAFKRRMVIGGYEVWAANLPYTLTSDAGHIMAEPGEPFAACYWDTADGRVFSLRSRDDGMDVAAIAVRYGGGGHTHASGFRLPHGVEP